MLAAEGVAGPQADASSGRTRSSPVPSRVLEAVSADARRGRASTPSSSRSPRAATSTPGVAAKPATGTSSANGYGNQTGLALTNLQGQYGGTAAKEKTRDTYHGFVFPEITDAARPGRRRAGRGQAQRPAQAGAGEDLGAVAGDVGLDAEQRPRQAQAGHRPSTSRRRNSYDLVARSQVLRLSQWRRVRPEADRSDGPDGLADGDDRVRAAPAGAGRPRGANYAPPNPSASSSRPSASEFGLDQPLLSPVLDVPAATCSRATSATSFQSSSAPRSPSSWNACPTRSPSRSPPSSSPPIVAIPLGVWMARGATTRPRSSARTSPPSPASRCPTSGSASSC